MPRDFKTILCPTDFSADAGRAIEHALHLAKAFDSTILLAHIIHIASEHLRDAGGQVLGFDQLRAQAQKELEESRDKHLQGYAKCELLQDIGDPYEKLMVIVEQRGVDLIVTSTHGRSSIENLLIGSVAERIIRHAPCPVFVVRRGVA